MNPKTIGVLAILGASVMWAIEPIFAKLSYANSNFLETSAIKVFVVAFIALTYVFSTNNGNLRINKKQFSTLLYIAIVATLFAELIYLYAFTKIPVVNGVLIGHLQPGFIVLFSYFVLKEEKLTKFDYFGIILMVIAGLLVSTRTLANLISFKIGTFGDFLVLLAAIAWATTTIAMRKYLTNLNAGVISFYRYLIASIALVTYIALTSSLKISNIYQIFVGIVVGLGSILYYEGLKRIKAAQAGALELSSPFFAAILGFLVLGELVTIMQVLGILFLFIGVYFLSKKEKV